MYATAPTSNSPAINKEVAIGRKIKGRDGFIVQVRGGVWSAARATTLVPGCKFIDAVDDDRFSRIEAASDRGLIALS